MLVVMIFEIYIMYYACIINTCFISMHTHTYTTGLRVQRTVWQCPLVLVHLYLAQVGQRAETHIVCVHLNKEKCQLSMAAGCLHVRWSSHWCLWLWGRGWSFQVSVSHVAVSAIIDLLTEHRETAPLPGLE